MTPASSSTTSQELLPSLPRFNIRSVVLPILALLLGPLGLAIVKLEPSLDLLYQSAIGHFSIVTTAAVVAVVLAARILRVAVVRQDGRVFLIGGGFLAISTIFLIHAISTPGVLFSNTAHATAWSTPLALIAGAVLLGSSTWERFAQQRWLIARWRLWLSIGGLLWGIYGGFMLFYVPARSAQVSAAPQPSAAQAGYDRRESYDGGAERYESSPPAQAAPLPAQTLQSRLMALAARILPSIYGVTVLLYGLTAVVYGSRWRRTPTRPLAVLTCGAILLAETAIAAEFGVLWHVSFWLYHVLLMAAVVTVAYGILVGHEQSGSFSRAVEGLLLGATLQRQREAFGRGMDTLLGALEHGDVHSMSALRSELRQRFALADDQLDLLEHAVKIVAEERDEQRRLRALVEVGRAVTHDLDPDHLIQQAVSTFVETTDVALCAVGIVSGDALTFAPNHRLGSSAATEEPYSAPVSALPAGWFQRDDTVQIGSLHVALAALAPDPRTALLIPLRHHEQVLGVLIVQAKIGTSVDERMINVCRSVGAQLATALANAQLYQELDRKHAGLLRSERMREQLTQMIVHDLKNPLTAIRGYHTLLHLSGLGAEQQELIAGAERGTATMLQLISDILDIARLEEGRLELHPTPNEIAAFLGECRDELRSWAAQEQKSITIRVEPDLPALQIDAALMRRIVTNLLSNALKHTPLGTPIVLGAKTTQHGAQLWVRDEGPGIPAERLPSLFDRFGATRDTSERQSNTGLGLTFCKLAVEAHGGTITVSSAPGIGTTFYINLPATAVAESVPTEGLILTS